MSSVPPRKAGGNSGWQHGTSDEGGGSGRWGSSMPDRQASSSPPRAASFDSPAVNRWGTKTHPDALQALCRENSPNSLNGSQLSGDLQRGCASAERPGSRAARSQSNSSSPLRARCQLRSQSPASSQHSAPYGVHRQAASPQAARCNSREQGASPQTAYGANCYRQTPSPRTSPRGSLARLGSPQSAQSRLYERSTPGSARGNAAASPLASTAAAAAARGQQLSPQGTRRGSRGQASLPQASSNGTRGGPTGMLQGAPHRGPGAQAVPLSLRTGLESATGRRQTGTQQGARRGTNGSATSSPSPQRGGSAPRGTNASRGARGQ